MVIELKSVFINSLTNRNPFFIGMKVSGRFFPSGLISSRIAFSCWAIYERNAGNMSFDVCLFTIALATCPKDKIEATVAKSTNWNKVSGDEMFFIGDGSGTLANQNPAVQAMLVRVYWVLVKPVFRLRTYP